MATTSLLLVYVHLFFISIFSIYLCSETILMFCLGIPLDESDSEDDIKPDEKLERVEKVHDEHLDDVRSYFQTRIKKLEARLDNSQKELKTRDMILNNFKKELKVESTQLNQSIFDLLSSSRGTRSDDYEVFHQQVVSQLEQQLNKMRKD